MNRPWPVPDRPWIMKQTWHDLLFAHWPVKLSQLRPLVPPGLPIDTFDGTAWLGVVPFRMSGVSPRFMPSLPYFSAFPEINLRTYVTIGGKPGVFFFSLDAQNRFAVETARLGFHLPYFYARIRVRREGDAIDYHSARKDKRAREAIFSAVYRPTSAVYRSEPGTLEQWLTERYCLYSTDRKGSLYRGEIDHVPWPLQSAEAEFRSNSLPASFGIALPDTPPLLHMAQKLQVRVWPLEKLEAAAPGRQ